MGENEVIYKLKSVKCLSGRGTRIKSLRSHACNKEADYEGKYDSLVESSVLQIKLFELQWQRAHFKDVSRKYRVRFLEGTTFGQYACLYARAELVVHLW
jgi:hypothetical protein